MSTALVMAQDNLPLALESGDLNGYLFAVSQIPVLSAEQEIELAQSLHDHDDLDAARQLILSQLRFVVHIARTYNGYGLPLADLIQEGNIGLMKAVRRFDPTQGVRLISFAVHWIRAEIHEYVLRNWRIVKVATTKAQRKLFFKLRSNKRRLGWFSHEEVQAVARDLDVDPQTVVEMESRLAGRDTSFDAGPEDTDESGFAPAEWLHQEGADPAYLLEHEDHSSRTQQALISALAQLDDRSRDIVHRRWLDEDNKPTLHDLAAEYGVSAERIRQLEKNAMQKMQRLIAA